MLPRTPRVLSARHILINRQIRHASASTPTSSPSPQPPPTSQPKSTTQTAPPTLWTLHQQEQIRMNRPIPPPSETPLPKGSNTGLFITAFVLIMVTPPGVFLWWQHRKEHMGKKKEALIKMGEERRRAWANS